jgi:hypothetical protein
MEAEAMVGNRHPDRLESAATPGEPLLVLRVSTADRRERVAEELDPNHDVRRFDEFQEATARLLSVDVPSRNKTESRTIAWRACLEENVL